MTAPARPRPEPVERPRQSPRRGTRQAPDSAPDIGSPRRRSSAAERAYARRAQRAETLQRQTERREGPEPRRLRLRLRWPRSRASFVLMLMALMVAGVATTLWLSTQAISDSYRLEELRQSNSSLTERSEELQRSVASSGAPARLAERAQDLGMVPGGNPARLVVSDDGKVRMVGEPKQATRPAPPPQPAGNGADRGAGDTSRDRRAGGNGGDGRGGDSQGGGRGGDARPDQAPGGGQSGQDRDRQAGADTRGDRDNGGDGAEGGDTGDAGTGDRATEPGAGQAAD